MKQNNYKTNVMRMLDQKKINYKSYDYSKSGVLSGMEVANILNQNPNKVFKTLVTVSNTKKYYVFAVPVNKELDLKKAASSVQEKSIEMVKSKELLNLTGYVHGGCSMIGMKKFFKTTIDESAKNYDTIIFSAGHIGYQVELCLDGLSKIIDYNLDDIC